MPRNRKSRKLLIVSGAFAAVCFLVFTIWIIHEANIGRDNILFKTVRATPYGDKIGHFLLAGFLTLIANFLLKSRVLTLGRLRLPWGSLVILVLVIAEESSQYYLPTRSLDIWDAVANFAGILVFTLPTLYYVRSRRRDAS